MYIGALETASNRADWEGIIQLVDAETGENIDITGCDIIFAVYVQNTRQNQLVASTDNGQITLPEEGKFQWLFSAADMRSVCAGTYDIGVTISQNDRTMQLIVGYVAVVEGNVP